MTTIEQMETIEQKLEQLNVKVGKGYPDTMDQLTIILGYSRLAQQYPASDSYFDKLCKHLGLLGQLARAHGQKRLSECVQTIQDNLCGLYS